MRRRLLIVPLVLAAVVAACSGNGDGSSAPRRDSGTAAPTETIKFGYSPWPGWYPLAVAEEAGIFEDVGLDVELEYFADYLSSLDAMAAGKLDVNAQTLNDTIAAVAGGDDQVIFIVGDNSTGNDQIICDESVTSIADLSGRTIGAEAGVVDHFLLLQGLESAGLTEADIDFRGILTADAAAAFAGGEFDCVGVFAPFTLQAIEREGAHVLFSSSDFPGTIPDLFVTSRDFAEARPDDLDKLVDAWYRTLSYIEEHPDESLAIMAEKAELSPAEYREFADGTTLFDVDQALASLTDGDDTTSLAFTARLINPFLVSSGLTEQEAVLDGLIDASFTERYAAANRP